jgi:putative FmdB family regulatory protein
VPDTATRSTTRRPELPTYQYACTTCDERLEAQQSFTDDPLTVCPSCEGRLRKVFNAVGIVFKGSGFYRNDSRSAPANATSDSSPSTESKTVESGSGADSSKGSESGKDAGSGKTPGKASEQGATKKPAAGAGESSSGASKSPARTDAQATGRGRRSESAA